MAEKKCCACGKTFEPDEQLAALNEKVVRAIERGNPGLDLGPSVLTSPAGIRRCRTSTLQPATHRTYNALGNPRTKATR